MVPHRQHDNKLSSKRRIKYLPPLPCVRKLRRYPTRFRASPLWFLADRSPSRFVVRSGNFVTEISRNPCFVRLFDTGKGGNDGNRAVVVVRGWKVMTHDAFPPTLIL